ncbi:hypothetical protein [Saccharothrix obliqua]|uniref:hypothetical protein n=1 Tax=Saccharothrix obliqua TaxID=2861747 RepID=UPI001C5F3064|nr:hypothetical protein [Saccharothrix obliqua]MBW4722407.1 hypothetical protein [Saccharothrix obliqua]
MARPITATCFPTPHLALRTTSPQRRRLVAEFAQHQATEAERLRVRLANDLRDTTSPQARAMLLWTAYAEAHAWRYSLALNTPDSRGTLLEAQRVLLSLDKAGSNADRLGYVGRHRDGADWDDQLRQYVGGTPTPAHDVLLHYGQLAHARFAAEHVHRDVLRNPVQLPDGHTITGNALVRGRVATRIAEHLAARRAARGHDVSRMETGGQPIYAVSAPTWSRDLCWGAGMGLLGAAEPEDTTAWWNAAYLLYQGIRHKRGSDATLRVFLVAAGAVLLDQPPVLPHDLDLRCMVLDQETVTSDGAFAQVDAMIG